MNYYLPNLILLLIYKGSTPGDLLDVNVGAVFFFIRSKIEADSKKWSQMTILMLFCSYRRCTSSKIGERKMSKIQIFENKAWKCGGPWGFFLQRFFKHFQYVPILAQMSTSAEAAVEFLPKNVENGFFSGRFLRWNLFVRALLWRIPSADSNPRGRRTFCLHT